MASSGQPLSPTGQGSHGAPALRLDLPQDAVDRPLSGFARDYPDGAVAARHAHARAQLLHATRGVMRVATDRASFVVPPGRALWVPPGEPHALRLSGGVAMRALFLRADAAAAVGRAGAAPALLGVSPLLRALMVAACEEPPDWDQRGRGPHLAALIADEIARDHRLPGADGLPEPRDPRLRRVAEAVRADPSHGGGLEDWAASVAGASPRTLSRLFARETGMGFAAWRAALRLAEASALLAEGATPARAAAAVGYASVPAFGAAYRAAYGITPGGAARAASGDGAR